MNAHTKLAIRAFQQIEKTSLKLQKAEDELEAYVAQIPDEDMSEYVAKTEKIRGEYAEKLATYQRRKEKREKRMSPR